MRRNTAAWRKRVALGVTTSVSALVRAVVDLYRLLPISSKVRERFSRTAIRIAPKLYRRVVASAGLPVSKRRLEAGPLWEKVPDETRQSRIAFWRLSYNLGDHVAKYGRITHVMVLPFFARGGAELTAMNFCRAILDTKDGSVLLVAADRSILGASTFAADPRILMISLSDYYPKADLSEREAMLVGLVQIASPDVFHVINSGVGWNAIGNSADRLRDVTKVFASIFAFQFDEKTGSQIGFAAKFLRDTMPKLDALLSDNHRLAVDAIAEYDLGYAADRIHVVYNPARTLCGSTPVDLSSRICQAKRLQVLWAGRLDKEKRIDLVAQIAELCPDMDFHVHGAKVVDASDDLIDQMPSNVRFYGPFDDPEEVVGRHEVHAFIFTSRWEGLPNVLLEFGALGLPIVAACVGGVGEVITSGTGYPLQERADAADYAGALREIISNPMEAQNRAHALAALISRRHSYSSFLSALRAVPGYLSSGVEADA